MDQEKHALRANVLMEMQRLRREIKRIEQRIKMLSELAQELGDGGVRGTSPPDVKHG